jgi:hypothetical protein
MTTTDVPHLSQDQWTDLFAKLSYPELHDIRVHITQRMKQMRETGTEQLRLKFIEDAAALGLTPEDFFGAAKKQRRKRRKSRDEGEDIAE